MYDRVSEFGSVTLAYSAASDLTLDLYTWIEGAQRPGSPTKTLTFPAAAARTQLTLTLEASAPASPVEGTHFQIKITSAGVFRLFGGKITARPIPVYVNGAATPSEPWLSPVMSIGGN